MDWTLWLVVALALLLLELVLLDLVVLALVAGALAGALAAALGAPVGVQAAAAVLAAATTLGAARAAHRRRGRGPAAHRATNVAAHVGRDAVVVATVTEHGGRVKLAGEVWSARRAPGPGAADLSPGTEVRVTAVDGATAVVAPCAHPTSAPP